MITCPKCQKQLEDGTKFCDSCGEQIVETTFCPNCGNVNGADCAFCLTCGAPLNGEPAPAAPEAPAAAAAPSAFASILDTFSCIFQGIIPYGAQMLVAITAVTELGGNIGAFDIIPKLFYPYLLLISSLIFIFIIPDRKEKK